MLVLLAAIVPFVAPGEPDADGPTRRPPHEYKPFLDKFRAGLEESEALRDALVNMGAPEAALGLAMELLRAERAPGHVLQRAIRASELDTVLDAALPEEPKAIARARQLIEALKDGSLLRTLDANAMDRLAGALRVELCLERAKTADDAKLPPVRAAIGRELSRLAESSLPESITDELRQLLQLPPEAPLQRKKLENLAQNPSVSLRTLLELLGRMSHGADRQADTLSPVTAPRRLREFRDALASSPGAGPAPGPHEPFFSIPGRSGGGVSLDVGGPKLRVVQGPRSTDLLFRNAPVALDSAGTAQANRLKELARNTTAGGENPVFPVELFVGNTAAQCNGAFASTTGRPLELGLKDEQGKALCEMPYQTARHCVEPQPTSIRIARLSRDPILAERIAVSRTGDQATIGIRMRCEKARTIPMLRIANDSEVARASMGVLFTNPKRHTDDGKRFLVLALSPGNRDFLGFNADLIDTNGKRVNDGVGTRVGDSGGPFVVYTDAGEPLFAGVNSFGVFPPGQNPSRNPSAYAQQGGIANGGKGQTLALIEKARYQAVAAGTLTVSRETAPATH
jgi:hypothetical protein